MGTEFEVNSVDEMCDLMCDNKVPTPEEEWWIFTFGYGQEHAGKYVKVKGSYGEARQKMCDKYGNKWAFQYSEDEWNGLEVPNRETELEVIE